MDWTSIIYSIPAVIIALTLHEFSHAFVSVRLGDATAREEGRLTLNPLRHIDPIGMIFIIVAGFGWAKPVRFDPRNLKRMPRDRVLIAAAGPLSNLAAGFFFLLLLKGLMLLPFNRFSPLFTVLFNLIFSCGVINLGLFIFNILPIPPLDGSHILFSGLNFTVETERRIIRFGTIALFALIILERRTGMDILPIGRFIDLVLRIFFPSS